jgi:hypothetical protein
LRDKSGFCWVLLGSTFYRFEFAGFGEDRSCTGDEVKGETMFRKLVKASEIEVDGRGYRLRFYELKTIRGGRRFSCEVQLTAVDRVILDDDSMSSLESKVARLAPATVYSRLLAAGPSFAA